MFFECRVYEGLCDSEPLEKTERIPIPIHSDTSATDVAEGILLLLYPRLYKLILRVKEIM